jgi:hypothetical protein
MPYRISRRAYAETYGPTTGDRLRLADTELILEVERDFTVYGDEVKFGGGKVIRDGMGQAQTTRADGAVDTVITNALILDWWGIVKADIGLRDGRIVAIGKAGNPDTQAGVDIVVGPGTEAIAGEGHILTAGSIDTHVHFICPQQIETALHPRGDRRADPRRCLRPQAPRRLGHHPGRDRLLPHGGRPLRCAGVHPLRHAQRSGLRGGHDPRHRRPHHPHLPHRGGRRRPRPRHHQDLR